MFQLHDATRRRLCVGAFLVSGLLPTLLAGAWCLNRHAPGNLQAEAQQLSRELGLNVKLGGLEHVRPGVVLYEQFEATDPETSNAVLRCRLLEVARQQQTNEQGQRRTVFLVTASQPEVEAASLPRVWQCLTRALEGFCGSFDADIQVATSELTLQAATNSQTLTAVEGAIENVAGGSHAHVQFRLAGAETPEPILIRVVRDRQKSLPTSGFELYTGDGELPCNVLAMGLPDLRPLGPSCCFTGRIWGEEARDGWQGQVAGNLAKVDLGRLVSENFPHHFSGIGNVEILAARFCHGRLEEGSVIVTAGPGIIDRSLMSAAVECLRLMPGQLPKGDTVQYEQLAFLATLDAQGLRLGGRCETPDRAILTDESRRCLLGESLEQSVPAVALARMLVPPSIELVPASRQTDRLLSVLPVPDVMPPAGAAAIPPHARARVRETWQR